jgi:predicted signal transduction protein with EAL and GGDEF domain
MEEAGEVIRLIVGRMLPATCGGEDLLRAADEALYQAKALGKNQALLAGGIEYADLTQRTQRREGAKEF